MKKLILSLIVISSILVSCSKDNNDTFAIDKKQNAEVELESKDLSHLRYAVYTKLDDGKIVVFFSQFDLKRYYDAMLKKSTFGKKDIKLPNQIFYLGISPAKEGHFPDLAKRQVGAISYTKLILNLDMSISKTASQKYLATHVIISATTPPFELGKYNIDINSINNEENISGDFTGILAKIDMETQRPDATAAPLKVSGSFEKAEYVDFEKVKEMLPFDISPLLK